MCLTGFAIDSMDFQQTLSNRKIGRQPDGQTDRRTDGLSMVGQTDGQTIFLGLLEGQSVGQTDNRTVGWSLDQSGDWAIGCLEMQPLFRVCLDLWTQWASVRSTSSLGQ